MKMEAVRTPETSIISNPAIEPNKAPDLNSKHHRCGTLKSHNAVVPYSASCSHLRPRRDNKWTNLLPLHVCDPLEDSSTFCLTLNHSGLLAVCYILVRSAIIIQACIYQSTRLKHARRHDSSPTPSTVRNWDLLINYSFSCWSFLVSVFVAHLYTFLLCYWSEYFQLFNE